MKFKKFKSNKLWRDKIVEKMEKDACNKIHWKKLDDAEFEEQLKLKLIEEAQEVHNTKTKEHLIEELADVLEVMNAICELNKIEFKEIIEAQNKKFLERGGYKERKFVTVVEFKQGSEGEKYCLADPEKYPEIID